MVGDLPGPQLNRLEERIATNNVQLKQALELTLQRETR